MTNWALKKKQNWFNIHKSFHKIHHINKLKKSNCMIILKDTEKAFNKNPTLLQIKSLSKLAYRKKRP